MIEVIIKRDSVHGTPSEEHSFKWTDDQEESLEGWEQILRTVMGGIGFHTASIDEFLGKGEE